MAGRRVLVPAGGAAALGLGYYFFKAGGDSKVAKKEFERKYPS